MRAAMVDAAGTRPGTVDEPRALLDATLGSHPLADGVDVEPVEVVGRRAEWLPPPEATDHALLYVHGAGHRIGSIDAYRALGSQLAAAVGAPVLTFDYRLAPEHRFPAAVDDAVGAYMWLLDGGLAPERLAIAGDSTGGGLTVATMVALRDRGAPQPGAAAALSPWADLTVTAPSHVRNAAHDPYVDADAAARASSWCSSGGPR